MSGSATPACGLVRDDSIIEGIFISQTARSGGFICYQNDSTGFISNLYNPIHSGN